MKYIDGFRNGDTGKYIADQIVQTAKLLEKQGRVINLMEVCGSHTMSIARYGIRDVLPSNIKLISGPGCPVCVTDAAYVDAAILLAKRNCIICTFGDMVRVPGTSETLAELRSEGADIRVCYSPLDAIGIAKENTNKEVIFLAIGFETTMAPVTSLIKSAIALNLNNLSLLTAFKLVPPALSALISDPEVQVDAFICPAHVSAIIGSDAYLPYVQEYKVSCVVAGFEPLDILYGILSLANQLAYNKPELVNQYGRVVKPEGNLVAQALFEKYLAPIDASWRGIGVIPQSGLGIKTEYQQYDAAIKFNVKIEGAVLDERCKCGDVLKGKILPSDCPMFDTACTPSHPVGPCMVSSEGSCAAHYKYAR